MCVIWIGLEQSDSKTSPSVAQYSGAHNAPTEITEMGFHYNKTYFRVSELIFNWNTICNDELFF